MSTNTLDLILAYENGELGTVDVVHLFAELVRTGQAWSLQGSYGRTAKAFIDKGVLGLDGQITPYGSALIAQAD